MSDETEGEDAADEIETRQSTSRVGMRVPRSSLGTFGRFLRGAVADHEVRGSLSSRARARRWILFTDTFKQLPDMRVLDLGGTVESWTKSTHRPREVILVNEYAQNSPVAWIKALAGDACSLPSQIKSDRFDLVFSNSVIEHVGGYSRRQAFAASVHAMADRHWIQTPNRYFPIEPHWVFPGFQFLPLATRAWISDHWSLTRAYDPSRSPRENVEYVLSVELIGPAEMRHLFPDSQLLTERFAGLPKSLIAVKTT